MDGVTLLRNLLAAGVARGAPIYFAALGELFAERSGVLNLGLEGMMLLGAAVGVGAAHAAGSVMVGVMAACLAGAALAALHAFVTVSLRADQVVSGLALVFLGSGLAAVLGAPLVELRGAVPHLSPVPVPGLESIPFLGPILFRHNLLVYLAMISPLAAWFWLHRTRAGLVLQAAGESPETVAAMGLSIRRIRYGYVILGGALAGLAGACLSLAITPGWVEGMTAGQGWIALGLVIFARWRPVLLALGAVLFGVVRRLPLDLQGSGVPWLENPDLGYFLNMLPYLVTIAVLVFSRIGSRRRGTGAPAALGRPLPPS